MNDPRLRHARTPLAQQRHLTTDSQQLIERLDTMEHKRLMHLLRQQRMSTESLHLKRKSLTTGFIQPTLPYRPHPFVQSRSTHKREHFSPIGRDTPRMQPHRKRDMRRISPLPMTHIGIQQTRHIVNVMRVEIEHHLPMKSFRHRVIPVSAPRMTAQETAARQIQPFQRPMLTDGIDRILGTSRCKTASGRKQRRNDLPIEIDGQQQQKRYHCAETRNQASPHVHKPHPSLRYYTGKPFIRSTMRFSIFTILLLTAR